MRRRSFWILLACAALLLTGCLQGGEDLETAADDEPAENGSDPVEEAASTEDGPANATEPEPHITDPADEGQGPSTTTYELAYPGPSVSRSIPIEGSFGPDETCVPAGCAQASAGEGEPHHHEIEFGAEIPAGLPVRVKGAIAYDQETTGDLHPNLRLGEAEVYGARLTNNRGPSHVDVRLSSPAGNRVVLEIGGHAPDGAEGTAYSGHLDVSADPTIVPAGVPTGVPVPSGTEAIELSPAEGDTLRFTLWDPDGERVTRTTVDEPTARIDLANGTDAARYAVQVEAPSAGAQVAVVAPRAPSGSLTPLGTTAVLGQAQEATPGQPVTGSVETAVPPVAVGVYERGIQPLVARTGEDPALTIRSPTATVMDRPTGAPATFDTITLGSISDAFATAPGLTELGPGTYEFEVADHRDAGVAFGGFAVVYENATAGDVAGEGPADPGWPPVDEAAVRPGSKIVGGSCTASFVFSTPDNRSLYVGTNSHCVDNRTIGETVEIANGRARGALAYCAWGAMDGTDTCTDREDLRSDPTSLDPSREPGDLKHDFALVRIEPAFRDEVHPAMREFGGPTGLAGPPSVGDPVLTYGNSGARDASDELKPREGFVREADAWWTRAHFVVPPVPGDSGSPVTTGDGRALGTISALELETSAGIVNFEKALPFAERHMGVDLELKTWPAEGSTIPSDPGP